MRITMTSSMLYKPLIYIIALLSTFSGCSITKITLLDKDLTKVRTVALVYEKGEYERPENLINECSQSFKKYLKKSNLKIIDLNDRQSAAIQKILQNAIISGDFTKTETSGIDAFFVYKITDYREDKKIGFRKKRTDGFLLSHTAAVKKIKLPDSDDEIIEIKTFYFRIEIRLIQNRTGKILLTAENSMSKATDELGVYESMDNFKRYVLTSLGKDIKRTLKTAKK